MSVIHISKHKRDNDPDLVLLSYRASSRVCTLEGFMSILNLDWVLAHVGTKEDDDVDILSKQSRSQVGDIQVQLSKSKELIRKHGSGENIIGSYKIQADAYKQYKDRLGRVRKLYRNG